MDRWYLMPMTQDGRWRGPKYLQLHKDHVPVVDTFANGATGYDCTALLGGDIVLVLVRNIAQADHDTLAAFGDVYDLPADLQGELTPPERNAVEARFTTDTGLSLTLPAGVTYQEAIDLIREELLLEKDRLGTIRDQGKGKSRTARSRQDIKNIIVAGG